MQLKLEKKPPAMSENQLAIKKLEKKVKSSMDKIEHKDLYCDSLENDFFGDNKNKNTDFQDMMYQKRILERENRELLDFINHYKKREGSAESTIGTKYFSCFPFVIKIWKFSL